MLSSKVNLLKTKICSEVHFHTLLSQYLTQMTVDQDNEWGFFTMVSNYHFHLCSTFWRGQLCCIMTETYLLTNHMHSCWSPGICPGSREQAEAPDSILISKHIRRMAHQNQSRLISASALMSLSLSNTWFLQVPFMPLSYK